MKFIAKNRHSKMLPFSFFPCQKGKDRKPGGAQIMCLSVVRKQISVYVTCHLKCATYWLHLSIPAANAMSTSNSVHVPFGSALSLFISNCVLCPYRIYERVIDPPETNLPPGSNLWLGQRNQKHGLFKVSTTFYFCFSMCLM